MFSPERVGPSDIKKTVILLPTYRRYSTHLPKLREYKCYVRSVVRILISEDVPEVKL